MAGGKGYEETRRIAKSFNPRKYWRKRGRRYTASPVNIQLEIHEFAEWLSTSGVQSLLDVGSGWGRIYNYLRGAGYRGRYTMVDFVDTMRRKCQDNTGVLPDAWDGKTLPYKDKSFDLVMAWEVMLHVPSSDIGRFFAECSRVTRRWLFFSSPGTIFAQFADHCFRHDYLGLAVDHQMIVSNISVFKGGQRINWLFKRSEK